MIWWSHAWNIHSKESKPVAESDTSAPIFIAMLFSIAKVQKQTNMLVGEWMDKENVVSVYNRILFSHKK